MYNDKTGTMTIEFFYSVDRTNLKCTDTYIVLNFRTASMVLIIHFLPTNLFVLSFSGYEYKTSRIYN